VSGTCFTHTAIFTSLALLRSNIVGIC